jgi:DNA-binding MarR family transcriptional regulator
MPSESKVFGYFCSVADARFIMRKVVRIVDEAAKERGLDPLEHQALIQIYGSRDEVLVRSVAERLDISPTFASKLVKNLIAERLATAHESPTDSRASLLRATPAGARLLAEIDAEVRVHVNMFARSLRPDQKSAALAIFSSHVGAEIEILSFTDGLQIPVPAVSV